VLIAVALLVPASAGSETVVSESAISMPATELPEFKTDPWMKESEGNQISGVVRVVHQDGRGWFWFGTQNGLARSDGSSLVYFDIRDAHDHGVVVRAIAEDREGNLWFGTSGGITRYDGEYFTSYGKDDGLASGDVWSLHVDGHGALWIGTLDGAFRFDGNGFTPFALPEGERSPERGVSAATMVTAITEDREGNLWFVVGGRVCEYDGRAVQSLVVPDGDAEPHVTALLEDRNSSLWFGTDGSGVIRFDGDSFTNVTRPDDLGEFEVNCLFEDSGGRVWFTAEGLGVGYYEGRSLTTLTASDGLESHAPFFITEDASGRIWFAGWRGVFRYDGSALVNVTRDGPW
jgi:ligand-binding sensor domain-containing protein